MRADFTVADRLLAAVAPAADLTVACCRSSRRRGVFKSHRTAPDYAGLSGKS